DAAHIYILNIPDTYRGAYIYRAYGGLSYFAETMTLMGKGNIENKTTDILYYNIAQPNDSVYVEIVNENTLKLTFAQWGNWFWMEGIGAKNYSRDDFTVEIDEWGHSYLLTFKNKIPGAVYLYEVSGKWREVEGF